MLFFIGRKNDYDLCGACFSHMGKDSEYTRLDKPASVNVRGLLVSFCMIIC
jgi:hypothetical protein